MNILFKELIDKYPFLQIKDNSVYPWLQKDGYDDIWIFNGDLLDGWVKAFAIDLCSELLEALDDYADKWVIVQVKEKYGEMRLYHNGTPADIYDKVENIIDKYSEMSCHTCVKCGEPSTRYTSGWIMPICDDCWERVR